MPRRDGRGPSGRGPVTGRGMGPCCSNQQPRDYGFRQMGRRGRKECGFERGYGYEGGYGYGYAPQWNEVEVGPTERKEILEKRKGFLEARLRAIDEILAREDKVEN